MNEDLLPQFLAEGRELVERAADDLMALERGAGDAELVGRVFRAVHTLKGSVGLFDLGPLESLLHGAETVLDRLRRAPGEATAETTGLLLDAIMETERWLDELAASGAASAAASEGARSLILRLSALRGGGEEAAPPVSMAPSERGTLPEGACTAVRYRPSSEAYFRGDDPVALMAALPGLISLDLALAEPAAPPEDYQPFECNLVLSAFSSADPATVRHALRFVADQAEITALIVAAQPTEEKTRSAERSLRVDEARLDALVGLVDELVVARNAAAFEAAREGGTGRAVAASQAALDRSIARLHEAVMDLRLAPLSQLFSRLPRQVRSIAQGLGKPVELKLSGGDLALDKTIADGLFEPVIHLLRNAIDHGVEDAEARQAAGKPATSVITLSARARGADAVIELTDDGRGLDTARIRSAAVSRGLADAAEVEAMDDAAANELIFAPGFSTAAEVSSVSGRGVGMDAVRAAIGRLGGRVGIDSRPGKGMTVRMVLPLRMLLTKLAVVRVGDERFGVDLDGLNEIVRVPAAAVTAIRAGRAFELRGEAVPLLGLGELLGQGPLTDRPVYTVLVAGEGEARVGLAVDGLAERLEAPLRPLEGALADVPGLQGAVIQSDGTVLMVLDLVELAA